MSRAYEFINGDLALDFTNTVGGSRAGEIEEYLGTYGDLLAWAAQAGILAAERAAGLARVAEADPGEGARVLARAIELRESIYRLASGGVGEGHRDALRTLNGEIGEAFSRLRLATGADGFEWEWVEEPGSLEAPLRPIVRAAADLLASGRVERVRECGGHDCSWLFLDATKNRSRRWCDMRGCGNRAKVRGYRERRQGRGRGAAG